jgi:prolyl 4-hydroxylase
MSANTAEMTLAAAIDAAYKDKWDEAFALLRGAAGAGDASARAQLDVIEQCGLQTLLERPQMERIHDESAVFVCRGFAPAAICDWLIESTRPHLQPSFVKNSFTGKTHTDPHRTATNAAVDFDFITAIVQERAARLTRVPVSHHETPSIISYEVGQKFDYHHDFLDPDHMGSVPELIAQGQRTITVVTYLNTEFEGAHTEFPRLNISFRGGKGDAILFSNVLPNGAPDRNTWHAGLPPTAGRKWVLSQWIRNRPWRQV